MCGILGGWWLGNQPSVTYKIQMSLSKLAHRGPDDRGYTQFPVNGGHLFLGHTRLSIIDLSSAGHQPFVSACGRWSLIFNGEIYNYKELRLELQKNGHHFQTNTDTEVLLISWKQWGITSLKKMIGMFSFVMYDSEDGSITCVRDAFGIKPFYYGFTNNSFYFASEIPAVLALQSEKPKLNWQTSYDYLIHGHYDNQKDTFVDGIKHLLPGHYIVFNPQEKFTIEQSRWWQPSVIPVSNLSFAQAAEELRHRFLENIKLHLRSDVPVGAALSGGIDSSAVVCAIRHVCPDIQINTFSYIAKGTELSEESWVDRVNKFSGCVSHKISTNGDELFEDLDNLIRAQGEPFGSSSIYAQYKVFQLAKKHGIKVTLDGQGADELLSGYIGYPGYRIQSLMENGNWIEAYNFVNNWSKWPGRSRSLALKYYASLVLSENFYDAAKTFQGFNSAPAWINTDLMKDAGVRVSFQRETQSPAFSGRRVIEELSKSLETKGLPGLLRHGDRNSMAFSIESRVPFLTTDLADFLLSLPEQYLISDSGETKSVFRAAMRGIVPDEILDRKDKIGFSTPENYWLTGMPERINGWLEGSEFIPFINKDAVLREFDMLKTGKKVARNWSTWRWINFIRWYNLVGFQE